MKDETKRIIFSLMKIFLCGDVMIGRGIDQIFPHHVSPELYEDYVKDARDYVRLAEIENGPIPRNVDDDYIWGDALPIWKHESPDCKIINLETAVTLSNTPLIEKGINYRMHPDNLSTLKLAGIDVCALANNHLLDWGHDGFLETLISLDKKHIQHSGAGDNLAEAGRPAIVEFPEGRVLVFSMSFESSGVPWTWEASESRPGVHLLYNYSPNCAHDVSVLVAKYKRPGDIVIASIHWGGNWGFGISEGQRKFAHEIIDVANVDIVHGHSSHHPKAIEIYHGRPVFYGCGDFINDYEGIRGHEEYRADLSFMYFLDLKLSPFRLKAIKMNCMQMRRFQLIRASQKDTAWMLRTLNHASKPFGTNFISTGDNVIEWEEHEH